MRKDKLPEFACFVLMVTALAWAVLGFGAAADDPQGLPHRTIAMWATAVAAVTALLLLPGRRRVPNVHWVLGAAGGVLLIWGWFMVLNAKFEHDLVTWTFTEIGNRPIDWAPGSVARATSVKVVLEVTVVLLALLAASRATERYGWRMIVQTIALFGAGVALIGMLHKATGAETVWWISDRQPGTIFAPFVYNANAGAFMNLALPLAVGLALARIGDDSGRASGIFWSIVVVVIATGVVAAASKGATFILVLSLPLMLLWNRHRLQAVFRSWRAQRGRKLESLALLGTLMVLVVALVAIGIAQVVQRWGVFMARFEGAAESDITGREDVIKLLLRMAAPNEGGWSGFGPGTFQHLVPFFTMADGYELKGRWIRGHCDPLQTVVEWGYLGAAGWFVIGLGAVGCGFRLLRRRLLAVDEVPVVRGAVVALVMVGVHSTLDFPLSIFSIRLSAMLLCGICWGLWSTRRREGAEEKGKS